ncbi:hypothetical protein F4810DRAFT_708011 [Camillea tinctor]|nr:hypothetical protein F4810DRAFT_708011 [Camillea tinctor]
MTVNPPSSSSSTIPRGPVTATLNFATPLPAGVQAFNYTSTPPAGQPKTNVVPSPQSVVIQDIRGRESSFTLDHDAFEIVRQVAPSRETEFVDDASIAANYYPEVTRLLLSRIAGSTRVVIFDHTVRRTAGSAARGAVLNVHIDQTASSAAKRVVRHLGPEAEALLQGRYRIVNVWRPLNAGPVESQPLAYASSASLRDEDVLPIEHRYPEGYVGQIAGITYHPGQEWYYLSGMTGDERILLECFDSEALKEGSGVRGGRAAHTAFNDPRTRPDAEGRESIEVRALVFGP